VVIPLSIGLRVALFWMFGPMAGFGTTWASERFWTLRRRVRWSVALAAVALAVTR